MSLIKEKVVRVASAQLCSWVLLQATRANLLIVAHLSSITNRPHKFSTIFHSTPNENIKSTSAKFIYFKKNPECGVEYANAHEGNVGVYSNA